VFPGQRRERKTNKTSTIAPDSIILAKKSSGHARPTAHMHPIDASSITPSALRRLSPPNPAISRHPHDLGRLRRDPELSNRGHAARTVFNNSEADALTI
jgi:hypothetical protein